MARQSNHYDRLFLCHIDARVVEAVLASLWALSRASGRSGDASEAWGASGPMPALGGACACPTEQSVRRQIPSRSMDRQLPEQARVEFRPDSAEVWIGRRDELWADLAHCDDEDIDEPRRTVGGRDVVDRHRATRAEHERAACAHVDGIEVDRSASAGENEADRTRLVAVGRQPESQAEGALV